MWGIRPPRGLWYHFVAQRPSPIPPYGRSGISRKCCAFLAAYAASYTQSVSHRLCLPPFESSLKKRLRVPFVGVFSPLTRQTAAQIGAPLGSQARSRHADAPGGSAPAPLRGAPPAKPGAARASGRQAISCWHTFAKGKRQRKEEARRRQHEAKRPSGRQGKAEKVSPSKAAAKRNSEGEKERKKAKQYSALPLMICFYFFLNSSIPLFPPFFFNGSFMGIEGKTASATGQKNKLENILANNHFYLQIMHFFLAIIIKIW